MDRITIISTVDKMPLLHAAQIDNNEGYYCIYNDYLVDVQKIKTKLDFEKSENARFKELLGKRDFEISNLKDALIHIADVAGRSRSQSRRDIWIQARAESTVNGNDDWKELPKPANPTNQLMRQRVEIKELKASNLKIAVEAIKKMSTSLPFYRYENGICLNLTDIEQYADNLLNKDKKG